VSESHFSYTSLYLVPVLVPVPHPASWPLAPNSHGNTQAYLPYYDADDSSGLTSERIWPYTDQLRSAWPAAGGWASTREAVADKMGRCLVPRAIHPPPCCRLHCLSQALAFISRAGWRCCQNRRGCRCSCGRRCRSGWPLSSCLVWVGVGHHRPGGIATCPKLPVSTVK
jgi:hypothetical protein